MNTLVVWIPYTTLQVWIHKTGKKQNLGGKFEI